MLFFTIFLFWLIFITIFYGVWYILEKYYPKPFSCFDLKPFNCRKCLTTWSMLGTYISVGLMLNNYVFMVHGIVISILSGLALYIDEKNRFKI